MTSNLCRRSVALRVWEGTGLEFHWFREAKRDRRSLYIRAKTAVVLPRGDIELSFATACEARGFGDWVAVRCSKPLGHPILLGAGFGGLESSVRRSERFGVRPVSKWFVVGAVRTDAFDGCSIQVDAIDSAP